MVCVIERRSQIIGKDADVREELFVVRHLSAHEDEAPLTIWWRRFLGTTRGEETFTTSLDEVAGIGFEFAGYVYTILKYDLHNRSFWG